MYGVRLLPCSGSLSEALGAGKRVHNVWGFESIFLRRSAIIDVRDRVARIPLEGLRAMREKVIRVIRVYDRYSLREGLQPAAVTLDLDPCTSSVLRSPDVASFASRLRNTRRIPAHDNACHADEVLFAASLGPLQARLCRILSYQPRELSKLAKAKGHFSLHSPSPTAIHLNLDE